MSGSFKEGPSVRDEVPSASGVGSVAGLRVTLESSGGGAVGEGIH